MRYPIVTADLEKLAYNARYLASMCHERGISLAAVTKCVCADARIAETLLAHADMLADARTTNLSKLPDAKPRMLLRIAMPDEAAEAVANAEISLQSELATIARFGAEAKRQGRRHRVALMIDLGDLREGVLYTETAAIARAAQAVLDEPALELIGVATNLSCFGGILPDETNLGWLVQIAQELRGKTGLPLPFVSGGNTSSIGLLKSGRMPRGITNLRLGESILLGNDTSANAPMPELYSDVFTVSAMLVEVQKKPSMPIGTTGLNAFGEKVEFHDEGEQLRGILAIGRQDVSVEGLTPLDKNVRVLGASSDHLIVDLTKATTGYHVGDILSFTPDYGALLRAYTSPYIEKRYQ